MLSGATRGQLGEQLGAKVEVRAVRLAGELAQRRAVLGVDLLAWCAFALGGTGPPAARLGRGAIAQLLNGPRDRLLGQLAVQRWVGDDRVAAIQLDQDPSGAGLIGVGWVEAKRRRAVGVLVDLLVELLGLGDERSVFLPRRNAFGSRCCTVFRYAPNVSLPAWRRAWPIAHPALSTSCEPATSPAAIDAMSAPGDRR